MTAQVSTPQLAQGRVVLHEHNTLRTLPQFSQLCTFSPFFALLIRPVLVYLTLWTWDVMLAMLVPGR